MAKRKQRKTELLRIGKGGCVEVHIYHERLKYRFVWDDDYGWSTEPNKYTYRSTVYRPTPIEAWRKLANALMLEIE